MACTVVVPFLPESAADAATLALAAQRAGHPVVLAGPLPLELPGVRQVHADTRDDAVRAGLRAVETPLALVHAPEVTFRPADAHALLAPLQADGADATYAVPADGVPLVEKGLAQLARAVTGVELPDAFPALRAFRMEAVRPQLERSNGATEADTELLVRLSAQAFRLVPVSVEGARPEAPLQLQWQRAQALLRYLGLQNDADNVHEGYNTLARMESAPHYNAWLAAQFRPWLGSRVLEVGAGIGTMTQQLAPGRELLVALELDAFYVERLRNLFRDVPHVKPVLSGVEAADWARLRTEQFDTVVMSNVLEHIEDDVGALRNLRSVLPAGGRLVLFVPALQGVFGSLDEAVGHFRRYEEGPLRSVMEQAGFEVEHLRWMNLVGIPGWFFNSRLLRRRAMPPLQLRAFDVVAPLLAAAESKLELPVGLGLFAVGRAR